MLAKYNPNPLMPLAGSFHAWKRVRDAVGCLYLLNVWIPKDGDAVQTCVPIPIPPRKFAHGEHKCFCRARRLKVVAAYTTNGNRTSKTEFWSLNCEEYYKIGEYTEAQEFDASPYHEKGAGLTFYLTRQLAKEHI